MATIAYDLSDGELTADDVDKDPVGALYRCPSVKVTGVTDEEHHSRAKDSLSNAESFFLGGAFLKGAKERLG